MAIGTQSAKRKLVRAAKHLRSIKRAIAKYSAGKPHKIVLKSKGKKKLNIPKGPPQEISLLTGEMLYQMRAALDNLAFNLVKRNPNVAAIDPDWREHSQFPLRTRLPKNCTAPLGKKHFCSDLPGVPAKDIAVIELLQPYYGVGATNNALRFLAHLSNIDKHRHLNLIRPRTRKYESFRTSKGFTSRGHESLDRGAEINPVGHWDGDRTVYVNRRYETFVAFSERYYLGDATRLPLEYLLELILKEITLMVVPTMEKLIKNP